MRYPLGHCLAAVTLQLRLGRCVTSWEDTALSAGGTLHYQLVGHYIISWLDTALSAGGTMLYQLVEHCFISWWVTLHYQLVGHCIISWWDTALPFVTLHDLILVASRTSRSSLPLLYFSSLSLSPNQMSLDSNKLFTEQCASQLFWHCETIKWANISEVLWRLWTSDCGLFHCSGCLRIFLRTRSIFILVARLCWQSPIIIYSCKVLQKLEESFALNNLFTSGIQTNTFVPDFLWFLIVYFNHLQIVQAGFWRYNLARLTMLLPVLFSSSSLLYRIICCEIAFPEHKPLLSVFFSQDFLRLKVPPRLPGRRPFTLLSSPRGVFWWTAYQQLFLRYLCEQGNSWCNGWLQCNSCCIGWLQGNSSCAMVAESWLWTLHWMCPLLRSRSYTCVMNELLPHLSAQPPPHEGRHKAYRHSGYISRIPRWLLWPVLPALDRGDGTPST